MLLRGLMERQGRLKRAGELHRRQPKTPNRRQRGREKEMKADI